MSQSGRPHKTRQNTKEKAANDRGRWAGFFSRAPSAKALALVTKEKEQETPTKEQQRSQEAVTVTRARPSKVRSTGVRGSRAETALVSAQSRSSHAKDSTVQASPWQVHQEEESNSHRLAGFLLLFAMVGLISVAWLENSRTSGSKKTVPKYDQEVFKERVQFHRMQTGLKLNRERITTELTNEQTAPKLAPGAQRVRPDDIMAGVPLVGEAHHRLNGRERPHQIVDPDHPDARILYGLQEERDAEEWERKAMKQYVDDFIANAAAQGYKVEVDRNYNVKVMQKPMPVPGGGAGVGPNPRNPSSDSVPGAIE